MPLHAAGAYQLRREALIERDRALRTFVVDRLAEGWTPEQISRWLREETNVICGPWVARRSMPLSIGQPKGPSSCGVISRVVTNAAGHADRDLRKIPSRIASPSIAGCLVRSTSTKCQTKRFRTSSSSPISHPESAWASGPLPRDPQRALQRPANPVRIALLHLVVESRIGASTIEVHVGGS